MISSAPWTARLPYMRIPVNYRQWVPTPTPPSVICRGWLCSMGDVVLSQTLLSRGESLPAGFSGTLSPHGRPVVQPLIAPFMSPETP